jgi:tetratricopeptide (TPR) repeat protein
MDACRRSARTGCDTLTRFCLEESHWRATMPAMRRFLPAFSLVVLLSAGPGLAEDASATAPKPVVAKQSTPGPLATDEQRLDNLFSRLKKERSTEEARTIASEIREVFARSGSPTVDFLMESATKAIGDKRYGAALDFLDQVTILEPGYVEGWNQRATLHYLLGNYAKSMSDCARVLALEPRHLGALAGVAGILQETGRDQQALVAWQNYLNLYPADRDAQQQMVDLANKLAGQKT